MEQKNLILVGAGHAHLETLLAIPRFLEAGVRVTVINPDQYQYYSGMGPGLLSGYYAPHIVRFNVGAMSRDRGADFIEDRAVKILPEERLIRTAGGRELPYDAVSFNVGSVIDAGKMDTSFSSVVAVKPVRNLYVLRCKIEKELEAIGNEAYPLAVVGGGAAGVEVAANLARLTRNAPSAEVRLITRGRLLGAFSERVRRKALRKLSQLKVIVHEDSPVQGNTADELLLADGTTLSFRHAVAATGTRPPDLFRDSSVSVGPHGGLLIDRELKNPQHPRLFGGGDCVDFASRDLPKVGVYAVRENPILRDNLFASLAGEPLRSFNPQGKYLLILNMGDRTGIWHRNGLQFGGPIAFAFKDRIDRRFMETYQVSGERDEGDDCAD